MNGPDEDARLTAEDEAEDLRAISRMPTLSLREARFTVTVLVAIMLAGVAWLSSIGALACLVGAALALVGANIGLSVGVFVTYFIGFFAAALLSRVILAGMRPS